MARETRCALSFFACTEVNGLLRLLSALSLHLSLRADAIGEVARK